MTPEMEAHLREVAAMPDETIDTSDIPEVLDWSDAVRGGMYRPVKRQITLRLDADLVDFFEAAGKGYQTRINAALREWVGARRETKAG
ncbi:MAG: BrnA antitoxin family protein [Roseomonas sp.]|nr:BrnA antitoxin family protein [Roseomonas sp.]